jgi:hypothetical protein
MERISPDEKARGLIRQVLRKIGLPEDKPDMRLYCRSPGAQGPLRAGGRLKFSLPATSETIELVLEKLIRPTKAPEHEPYTDPTLGTATWNAARREWLFALVLPSGRAVNGSITPADDRLPLASPELEKSRACIRWVRDNEPALRQHVADKMYQLMLDWHDPEWGPALTKEQFRDKIALEGVLVREDHRASLSFSDAECFGGHAITFSVGADGRLNDEPDLWG